MCTALMRCDLFTHVRCLELTSHWCCIQPVYVYTGVSINLIRFSCLLFIFVWASLACSQTVWGRVRLVFLICILTCIQPIMRWGLTWQNKNNWPLSTGLSTWIPFRPSTKCILLLASNGLETNGLRQSLLKQLYGKAFVIVRNHN